MDRWLQRVRELERAAHGPGPRGALSHLVAHGRLPASAAHTGRRIARRARTGLVVASVVVVSTTLLVLAAVLVATLRLLGLL